MALSLSIFLPLHFSFCDMQSHLPNLLVHSPFFITPIFSILCNSFFNSSFIWTEYFLWSWASGIVFLLMYIFCFPVKLPIPWNRSGYLFARSSIFSIFLVSFVVIQQLTCTSPNSMDSLCPNIAISFLHI